MIKKAKTINSAYSVGAQQQPIPLTITVSQGNAPLMLWAVFALLIVSLFPYMLMYVCASSALYIAYDLSGVDHSDGGE